MPFKNPPNLLFLFPDQHRPDWLGCAGNLPLKTPVIDSLARRGTRFTNAYTPSPLCSPARACLATGMDYTRCGVRDNDDSTPRELPTYYRHLRDAGYSVSGAGKFDLNKPERAWGSDGASKLREYGLTGGIDNEGKGDAILSYRLNGNSPAGPYMQFLQESGCLADHLAMYQERPGLNFHAVTDLPEEAYCDNWIGANASQLLREFPTERPWHLVVNFTGPHEPYDVTPAMRERWESVNFPPPIDSQNADPEGVRIRRQNYAAMIENIDDQIGRLLRIVEERGELENTLVVYASDHGEMLGDHDLWGKSFWHGPSSGIPMILAGPGIPGNRTSQSPVSLHDLSATFLDYAGASPLPGADARSLRPFLEGTAESHREFVISSLRDWRMIFDGRHKLVIDGNRAPQLFDLETDPNECLDVSTENAAIVTELAIKLEQSCATD